MSLKSGTYHIQSAIGERPFVGRSPVEDFSLLPKQVIVLPQGTTPIAPWFVQEVDGGKYILKAIDCPTVDLDKNLFAVLLPDPPATQWVITPVPHLGENAYTVKKEDQTSGWVVPEDEPHTQIAIRPLIVGSSEPPFFPSNEVFIFKEVN